jgi:excisionase family DNA binding protein
MKIEKNMMSQKDAAGSARPSNGANDSRCRTISVEEAGRLLGISRGSVYAHAKSGAIPTIKLGKRLLVPRDAFERLFQGA